MSRPARRLVAALLALLCTVGLTAALAPSAQAAPPKPAAPALGLAGPYTPESVNAATAAGVSIGLIEMQWSVAEPAPGVYDTAYLRGIAAAIAAARASGYAVTLNTGIQSAPAWLLAKPGAKFVNQDGQAYSGQLVPNLVFGKNLRTYARAYLTTVFRTLGTDFNVVRVGGGMYGELSYPYTFDAQNLVTNSYWAFDRNAAKSNPVPGWKPGDPSPHGEAATFLTWYLNALVDYQNWQVKVLRNAGYRGNVAVLYPSYGMRPGDFDKAVATDLSGTSSAEINGEVQRGYDMARQVGALTDRKAIVYGTWGENLAVVTYLAGLAHAKGLKVMAENAGPNSLPVIVAALQNAQANGLAAFYLIRASDLMCDCDGRATLAQIGAAYQEMRGGR
ncbi:beta-galactosidase [Jatrophihabitans sp. YIM 134969]